MEEMVTDVVQGNNNEDLKITIGKNIAEYRKIAGLSQNEFAEKLNYSDKAISKWEVGSVLPDVETIQHIAEFFGITVNDLIYAKKKNILKEFYKTHLCTTLLVTISIWFVATIIFFVLDSATSLQRTWLTFIFTIPINAIVLIVLCGIWFKKIFVYLSATAFLWGTIIAIFLTINNPQLWFIFIVGVVGQGVISVAMLLRKKKN